MIPPAAFITAKNNYDSVTKLFDHVCGAGQYESIFCGQGELFRVPELKARTMNIWNVSDRRGANTHRNRRFQKGTKEKLRELLYPRDVFEKMADASWGVEKKERRKGRSGADLYQADGGTL